MLNVIKTAPTKGKATSETPKKVEMKTIVTCYVGAEFEANKEIKAVDMIKDKALMFDKNEEVQDNTSRRTSLLTYKNSIRSALQASTLTSSVANAEEGAAVFDTLDTAFTTLDYIPETYENPYWGKYPTSIAIQIESPEGNPLYTVGK